VQPCRLDALLDRADAYEVDLAVAHLDHARSGRPGVGRPQLPVLPHARRAEPARIDFAIRCSSKSFRQARAMLRGEGPDSQIVEITPANGKLGAIRKPACRRGSGCASCACA
jgi:hypothetical protein